MCSMTQVQSEFNWRWPGLLAAGCSSLLIDKLLTLKPRSEMFQRFKFPNIKWVISLVGIQWYTIKRYLVILIPSDISIYIYIYITDYQGYDKIYVYIVESNREIPYNLNQLMWNFDATPMWWFLYWPFTWLPFRSHLFKSTCRFCQTKKLASMPDYALPKILYVHLLLDVHAWFGCKDALPGDCLKKEWR